MRNEEYVKRLQQVIKDWKEKEYNTHYDLAEAAYILGLEHGRANQKLLTIEMFLDVCRDGLNKLNEQYKEDDSEESEINQDAENSEPIQEQD